MFLNIDCKYINNKIIIEYLISLSVELRCQFFRSFRLYLTLTTDGANENEFCSEEFCKRRKL